MASLPSFFRCSSPPHPDFTLFRAPINGGRIRACLSVDLQGPSSSKLQKGELGRSSEEVIDSERKLFVGTYARAPVVLSSGKGCKLYDLEGREYLDMAAGIAVNSLGHGDPDWLQAVIEQANTVSHVSNLFHSIPQVELAKRLVAKSFADRVFFTNSGTEANEAAIKFARKFQRFSHTESNELPPVEFIAFSNCFHGRTMGALALTSKEHYRTPFEEWRKSMELLARCSTLIPQASSLGLPNSHGKPSNFFPKLKSTLSFPSASSVLKTTALKPSRTLPPPCSVMTAPQTPDASRRGAETDAMGLLLRERIVFLGNSIDDFVADAIISQLLLLDAQDSTKDIRLFINSAGGSLSATMAIYDVVQLVRADVSTIALGIAASTASIILGGGTKGKRLAMPNARIMVHQPLGGASGQAIDVEIQAREIMHNKNNVTRIISEFTGHPFEKVQKDIDRDRYMSPIEAVEYGLIDGVIDRDSIIPLVPVPERVKATLNYEEMSKDPRKFLTPDVPDDEIY